MDAFRIALSVGQGDLPSGVVYRHGNREARNQKELQEIFRSAGSTEMFVRINTKRYASGEPVSGSVKHANEHNLETSLKLCRLAVELEMLVNPELMCVYTYMDMSVQEAPDFRDYPELKLPVGRWQDYSIEQMCAVLEQYGELIAREILATGCQVDWWNLGNEANFGFAGVNVGLPTAVNPNLAHKIVSDLYMLPHLGADYLKENVWCHNGRMLAATARGIRKAAPDARFSTHLSCSVADAVFAVAYYQTMLENGYQIDCAGLSIYPTSMPEQYMPDPLPVMQGIAEAIDRQCGLKVFVAEYAFPSGSIDDGPFDAWDRDLPGYRANEIDQARFTSDFLRWCRESGYVTGIRPYGPDILVGWEPMSMFRFDPVSRLATAKPVLDVFK